MHNVHHESDQRAALSLGTKYANSRQFREPLSRVTGEVQVMLKNRFASDSLDVINRRREANRASDIGCATLEPMRRFLKRALFQRNAHDHFAAAVPRRDCIENFSASIEHADSSRTTHFVSGKRKQIAAQLSHIKRHASRALR